MMKRYRSKIRRNPPLIVPVGLGSGYATWDFSSKSLSQTGVISGSETSPGGIFFKEDGTEVYVTGNTGNDITQLSLSTPWDLSTLSETDTFSVVSQESAVARDLHISPDGIYIFIAGWLSAKVWRYTLGTGWDLTTASYVGAGADSLDVSAKAVSGAMDGVTLNAEGTVMLITSSGASDSVHRYDLSTPWDLSTASFVESFSIVAYESNVRAIHVNPSGNQFAIIGSGGDEINLYSMSAFGVAAASHVGAYSVSAQDNVPEGIYVSPDGTLLFAAGSQHDSIYKYTI